MVGFLFMDLHNIERLLVMRLEGLSWCVHVMATLPKNIKLLCLVLFSRRAYISLAYINDSLVFERSSM